MEMGGLKIAGVRTSSPESAQAVTQVVQKIHKWHGVETICGDEATLTAAGTKIVREIEVKETAGS
jgi:hypothetical protein